MFTSMDTFKCATLDEVARNLWKDQIMKVYHRGQNKRPKDYIKLPCMDAPVANGSTVWVYTPMGFYEVKILRGI